MASIPLTLPTQRDLDVLAALDWCPFTVAQLLKLSETFVSPFTTERKLRARLQTLAETGRVRRHQYAVAGRGTLNYYTSSPLGYALLHGPKAPRAPKHAFSPISPARLLHTQALADFLVHTAVAAKRSGVTLAAVRRENTVRLQAGDDHWYPDSAFSLVTEQGLSFHFFVELDNGTEPVTSPKERESWQRKLQFYDRFQEGCGYRFRVVGLFTRGPKRIANVLQLAADSMRHPQRPLLYGISLAAYLGENDPLFSECFDDHRGRKIALVHAPADAGPSASKHDTRILASGVDVC